LKEDPMTDGESTSESFDFQSDHGDHKPAERDADVLTPHEACEAVSQILFSINLTVNAAQRAAPDASPRLRELLEMLHRQCAGGLELVRHFRDGS
jgi:hypothetical protein